MDEILLAIDDNGSTAPDGLTRPREHFHWPRLSARTALAWLKRKRRVELT